VTALLQVENLDLYYGDAQALAGVTLEVPQGEIVAIVGANGAGKSSLIRAIAGIEKVRSGKVLFRQADITRLQSHQICNLGIGQVAEGRQVFPSLTVAENLAMGGLLPRARAHAARTLDEVYALFPRLAERRGQLAGTLSGGEQQMLAIGRILRTGARLLLLDEPTEGLAPVIIQQIGKTIRALKQQGFTILLVEQNINFARRLGDTVAVMDNGIVLHAGSMQALAQDEELQHSLLGLAI